VNISAPFVRRPVATSLMAAALLLAGMLTARRVQEDDPLEQAPRPQ
jgi:multidrug efflux pump subunit AcrB